MPLPEDVPLIVELYLNWLYTGTIVCLSSHDGEEENVGKTRRRENELLVDGYVFGEKVQDGGFRDAIVDSLIHAVSTPNKAGRCWYPGPLTVDRAFKGTPERSPLRKLLVDMHVFRGNNKWLDGDNNPELLAELAQYAFKDKRASLQADPTRPTLDSCRYHHHSEGEKCSWPK